MDLITAIPRTIERPGPDSDVTVTALTIKATDEDAVQLVQVHGFEPDSEYLNTAEAHDLARALIAAADELTNDYGAGRWRTALTEVAVILALLAGLWFLIRGWADPV